jgi:myo-inositol-1(or 4)-monophosphatase
VSETQASLAGRSLDVITNAALRAATVISDAAPHRQSLDWVEKSGSDFVTEVDKASEACIAEVVSKAFPDAFFVGEELTPEDAVTSESLTFIADPIDGTTNFLHGFPHYSVSIAAMNAGDLIAGVVLNVTTGELFTATADGGAQKNGETIRVSSIDSVSRALIGTGFPFKNAELLERYSRQFIEVSRQTAGIRRAGSAALDLADVACGRFDGFWELVLAPWDVAAGILLVREAGGIVTDMSGARAMPASGPIVAGNSVIHPWLLQAVQSVAAS